MAFRSRRINLVERSHPSFGSCCFYSICRWVSSSFFFRWCRWGLSVGGLDRWGLGSLLGLTGVGHPRKLTPSRAKGVCLTWEVIASAKTLFYLLGCSFGFNFCKLNTRHWNYNNYFINWISWYCMLRVVFVHSRFVENPPIWSWQTNPSFLRWFYHS
jgi:hypothetical protein